MVLSQPKSQPKSAAVTKAAPNGAGNASTRGKAGRGKGRGGRAARSARPAKKTAEELDSEMADYFDAGGAAAGETAATNEVAQPAANVDAMEDEILVRCKSDPFNLSKLSNHSFSK